MKTKDTKAPKPNKRDGAATELVQLREALQRSQADLINFRARTEREKLELADFVKAQVIGELLPLIDNLERALGHTPKELADNDWAKGVSTVAKQVNDAIAKMGAERIKTVGELFDPNIHEAVSVDGEKGEEVVSEELQSGYRLGDTILRHAVVKVTLTPKKGK